MLWRRPSVLGISLFWEASVFGLNVFQDTSRRSQCLTGKWGKLAVAPGWENARTGLVVTPLRSSGMFGVHCLKAKQQEAMGTQ